MSEVAENKVASVHYTGTLPDTGEVFDSSVDREPLTFLVGHKNMIPGFEREIMGSKVGDKVEFTLAPEDAYGTEKNSNMIQEVPIEMFGEIAPEVGMELMSDIGRFTVVEVTDTVATVDFNPPLVGKSLTFNVEIIDIRDATEEEIAHGHAHGPGGHNHH
ncbi:MAG: peptidylprolyl isomerase [Euryarchaeota archaeon]|nr:peptidylprolyl isomerase [Euryarchaeota archaeon]|tara:strand:+ start:735 stop:1214 length:480 start_codon:yes stop_codon:yes gene_type:complete